MKNMKRPTKDRLLEAALAMVYRHGYKGATTKRIASEADVSEPTLYRHYPKKMDLIKEVVAAELRQLHEVVPEPTADLEADLTILAREYALYWEKHGPLLSFIAEGKRFPELRSVFAKEQRSTIDKLTILCLHHRAIGSWRKDFEELAPEQLEWDIASLILGPILAQYVWNEVGLSYGTNYDPRVLVRNVLYGIKNQ